jgi:hypothetical protein
LCGLKPQKDGHEEGRRAIALSASVVEERKDAYLIEKPFIQIYCLWMTPTLPPPWGFGEETEALSSTLPPRGAAEVVIIGKNVERTMLRGYDYPEFLPPGADRIIS